MHLPGLLADPANPGNFWVNVNPGTFVGDHIVICMNGSGVFWSKVSDAR